MEVSLGAVLIVMAVFCAASFAGGYWICAHIHQVAASAANAVQKAVNSVTPNAPPAS